MRKISKKVLTALLKETTLRVPLRLVIIGLGILLAKASIILLPLIFRKLVDTYATGCSAFSVVPVSLVVSYGIARFGSSAFDQLKEMAFARLVSRLTRSFSLSLLDHLHKLSHSYHLSLSSGAVAQSFQQGVRGLNVILSSLAFGFLPLFIEFNFMSVVVFMSFDWVFIAQLWGISLTYFSFIIYVTQFRLTTLRSLNQTEAQVNAHVIENLANFEVVKYFNKRKEEVAKFDALLQAQEELNVKSIFQFSYLRFAQATLLSLILAIYLYYACMEVRKGLITVGELVTLMAYLTQLFTPLEILAYEQDRFRKALIDVESMFKVLNETPTIKDISGATSLRLTSGGIQFDSVVFGYRKDRSILNNLSFIIPANKTTAIIGKTGSGKTTIARLLLRFYDVDKGSILIGEQDVRTVEQGSLRASIGVVSQEISLFNTTLFHNIAYGKPEASYEEVCDAAKKASFHEFVSSLPQGYDTIIGERGLKLSGGEKQRLALARALLAKPPILIFDEATASLDTATEQIIQRNIAVLNHQHTIVIIAHRLTTVMSADKIIVLDKGRVIEEGSHKDLISTEGHYSSLWKSDGGSITDTVKSAGNLKTLSAV